MSKDQQVGVGGLDQEGRLKGMRRLTPSGLVSDRTVRTLDEKRVADEKLTYRKEVMAEEAAALLAEALEDGKENRWIFSQLRGGGEAGVDDFWFVRVTPNSAGRQEIVQDWIRMRRELVRKYRTEFGGPKGDYRTFWQFVLRKGIDLEPYLKLGREKLKGVVAPGGEYYSEIPQSVRRFLNGE